MLRCAWSSLTRARYRVLLHVRAALSSSCRIATSSGDFNCPSIRLPFEAGSAFNKRTASGGEDSCTFRTKCSLARLRRRSTRRIGFRVRIPRHESPPAVSIGLFCAAATCSASKAFFLGNQILQASSSTARAARSDHAFDPLKLRARQLLLAALATQFLGGSGPPGRILPKASWIVRLSLPLRTSAGCRSVRVRLLELAAKHGGDSLQLARAPRRPVPIERAHAGRQLRAGPQSTRSPVLW